MQAVRRGNFLADKACDTPEIVAQTTAGFLETRGSVCYLNLDGDTVIPWGNCTFGSSDRIKFLGFVRDENNGKGCGALDNRGKGLFKPFIQDNGPDVVREGLFRIQDENGLIGFANTLGNVVVKP